AFTVRALRWFSARGVEVERLLTDNGTALPLTRLRALRAPAGGAPHLHPPLPSADQRQGRALDRERPARVPLSRGLPLCRAAPTTARGLDRPLQSRAPSSGAQRE